MPPVQRSGYAFGAAYIGIVANAAGLDSSTDTTVIASAARIIFLASIPFAVIGIFAALKFVSTASNDQDSAEE